MNTRKTTLAVLALFALTGAAVALHPGGQPPRPGPEPQVTQPAPAGAPRIDVVFALDTTGSMSGLIAAAREKIWSIATTLAQGQPAPAIRMGLVAYRDIGDDYVTRVVDLSFDLDSVYAALMDLRAGGGGDGPESVNRALADAVAAVSWSQAPGTYKAVFLVGDAPPHRDYQERQYPEILAAARQAGIVVNAVQAGNLEATREAWECIAALGGGAYFQVDATGSAVAIATPYDEALAELSARLDATRLFHGSAEEQRTAEAKAAAAERLHAEASAAVRARRAAFNASPSGRANLLGERELVANVAAGEVDLDTLAPEELPAPLRDLAPEQRAERVAAIAEERKSLEARIAQLARQRANYLSKEVEARGGAAGSLDQKLYDAVRTQTRDLGLRYEAAAPSY